MGLFVSSIAIVSEGANNATDALSSIMTLIGAKLAKKHPNEKHPFGYGKIEHVNDNERIKELRRKIGEFIRKYEHIKSYHAVYIDAKNSVIYCDFIVDYDLRDRETVKKTFCEYMAGLYPDYSAELTIKTEFV